jgi:hypothetical protein
LFSCIVFWCRIFQLVAGHGKGSLTKKHHLTVLWCNFFPLHLIHACVIFIFIFSSSVLFLWSLFIS